MIHNRAMWLYLLTVTTFLVLSWRVEHNADQTAENIYENCLVRNESVDRANILWRGVAEIERNNPFADQGPAEKAVVEKRIELYSQAVATKGECIKP